MILIYLLLSLPLLTPKNLSSIEHIVIFMQENRAFDHYFGTLRGVRGFNDRSAPPLPSGLSPFYQPVSPPTNNTLCGCNLCNITWFDRSIEEMINGMKCSSLMSLLQFADPPIYLTEGELCSRFISEILGSSFDGIPVPSIISSNSTCPDDSRVELQRFSENPYMLPFHLAFNETSATCMPAPDMGYVPDIKMWNKGRMDAWNTARTPGFGMSYFKREDLEYYYALADSFTIADQYFQSTFTETDPNRLHLFSGSNGLSINNVTMLNNDIPTAGLEWETLAETLEKENVSWKVYQELDNFDDNAFAWFKSFREAQPGSSLYEKGMRRMQTDGLVKEFYEDVNNGTLTQVSFIIAPTWLSEHATNHPQDGEDLTARLVRVLSAPENNQTYAKTLFILNYDEGGQFYDHHWVPTPPSTKEDGFSTVTTEGEIIQHAFQDILPPNPIGLGFRVPLLLISPWTRGPFTFSEVSDHTSIIKLIEERFGVRCPNISPWRRSVASDLLSAFDFEHPDFSWPSFPSTKNNTNDSKNQCAGLPYPTIPEIQSFPLQEHGVRKVKPLKYDFFIEDKVKSGVLDILIENQGNMTGVFLLVNVGNSSNVPKKYTVEPKKHIRDVLQIGSKGYNYSLHGPNGFVRKFEGNNREEVVKIEFRGSIKKEDLFLTIIPLHLNCHFKVKNEDPNQHFELNVSTPIFQVLDIKNSSYWYDFSIAGECEGNTIYRRYMGHLEVRKESTTDPVMGLKRENKDEKHPLVPEKHRIIKNDLLRMSCMSSRSKHKDECAEILRFDQGIPINYIE